MVRASRQGVPCFSRSSFEVHEVSKLESDSSRSSFSADSLESRFEFETLISDTSAALFSAPPEQLDLVIERTLDRVRG